ncbi:MAG TPA: (2Fe-2S)-binding protein [Ktedonobacterales bacterium]|jgi:aerobic-type carbon monoxide dehydrogenase small subunit (CoxS/CutS family)
MPENDTALDMTLTVNGRAQSWRVQPGETLLEALQHHNIKGPKLVCGTGDCSACGVIFNGAAINACCMLAAQADGVEVVTVEGLANGAKLHPIQEAFAEAGAAQCGYCTPGFIIRAYALLQENPDPTEEEVRAGFAGSICRCTGYVKPIEAALRAAALLREQRSLEERV